MVDCADDVIFCVGICVATGVGAAAENVFDGAMFNLGGRDKGMCDVASGIGWADCVCWADDKCVFGCGFCSWGCGVGTGALGTLACVADCTLMLRLRGRINKCRPNKVTNVATINEK